MGIFSLKYNYRVVLIGGLRLPFYFYFLVLSNESKIIDVAFLHS